MARVSAGLPRGIPGPGPSCSLSSEENGHSLPLDASALFRPNLGEVEQGASRPALFPLA